MAENGLDISAILTAHAEGTTVGVSFRSMLAAVSVAREADLDVEMLVALDRPDEATREMLAEVESQGARLLEVSHGDQAPVRNDTVRESRGRFIAFLDGDDLWAENWLVEAHALCANEPRTIAHPYADWVFGEGHALSLPPDQTDPEFDPATLRVTNAWDALCLAPREAYLDHPYRRGTRSKTGSGTSRQSAPATSTGSSRTRSTSSGAAPGPSSGLRAQTSA
jgi:glycosyltransferase involved in cell wall biosynthesis